MAEEALLPYVIGVTRTPAQCPERLTVLPCGEVSAIVAMVSEEEFGQEALDALQQDHQRLAEYAVWHQRQVQSVFERQSLVPFRFGTVYQSWESVERMLSERLDHWQALLCEVEGQAEWDLRFFASNELSQQVAETDPELSAERERLRGLSAGRRYLEQKRWEQRCTAKAQEYEQGFLYEAQHQLEYFFQNHIIWKKSAPYEDKTPLLRGIVLTQVSNKTELERDIDHLLKNSASISYILHIQGPWPPYHFVNKSKA
jgi:hypothetical protein